MGSERLWETLRACICWLVRRVRGESRGAGLTEGIDMTAVSQGREQWGRGSFEGRFMCLFQDNLRHVTNSQEKLLRKFLYE